jgi:hypothetical protein
MADDATLPDGGGAPVLYDGGMMDAWTWVFGNVHGTAADDRTAACASAEFRQSHLNRHCIASQFHVALVRMPPAIL